ncbi:MAG TPA: carboxypeptidase-like regulatory domain-containing protein [Puia sp.]|nr:carboxypeptidase-like regulatory domain-containing protein [Puia sp.]
MKKIKQLLLLTIGLSFVYALKAADGRSEPFLIQGQVTDAITKKPVSGVVVSAITPGTNNSKEVITDADGYFYFTQLPSTQVNLQFGKKGYQSYKRSCVLAREKTTLKINVEVLREDPDPIIEDDSEFPLFRALEPAS